MMTMNRINRLTAAMTEKGFDAVALMPAVNLRYLTGLTFHALERLTLMLFPASDSPPSLVLPAMEVPRVQSLADFPLHLYPWNDAEGPAEALSRAVRAVLGGLEEEPVLPTIGIEYTVMRVMDLRALEQGGSSHTRIQTADVTPLMTRLRIAKDQDELAAMTEAARIIEAAFGAAVALIEQGMTEMQLASILSREIRGAGGEGESFETIVASGPNSANPHHTSSDRPFQKGDLILMDAGAMYQGYASDMTRVVALGEAGPVARHIYELVRVANEAGRGAARPGTTGEQIDQVVRGVIAEGGYGEQFLHRTGHGLGLECHEPPYLVEGSTEPLPVGATFTIEPGIYVEGLGGVRIEDDVVLTEDGCRSLTTFERDLLIIPA
jgi:Xaa-Pro dipeptidase